MAKKILSKTKAKSSPKKTKNITKNRTKKVAKKVIKKLVKPVISPKEKKPLVKAPAPKKAVVMGMEKYQGQIIEGLVELIKQTSTIIPDDIQKVILEGLNREIKDTTAAYAMNIIQANMELAKKKAQPLCQDTGTVIFYISHPVNFDQNRFTEYVEKAVVKATEKGYLRQNSVNSLTGQNSGLNLGPGHPSIHYHQHHDRKNKGVEVKMMLKGGGCENVGAQYSLPHNELGAGRDLDGVRKVILDAVFKAQGKGCGPGVLGVCIGGDRGASSNMAKEQLLRRLDDHSPLPELADLEKDIVQTANELGIGPMGFGGKTTLLGCKINHLNRLPASFFVSISYMCWAFRRQGISMGENFTIKKWLY